MDASQRIDELIANIPDWRGKTFASVRKAILAADKEIERYPLRIPGQNIQVVPVTQVFEGAALLGGPAGAQ